MTELKVLSYNIDTNIGRTEEGYARESFSKWRANERKEAIIQTVSELIAEHIPDIIQIQEGREFTTKFGDKVDSITDLTASLEAQGYTVVIQSYRGDDQRAFKYITAFNSKRFDKVEEEKVLFLTKTPHCITEHPSTEGKTDDEKKAINAKILDNNFGELWERDVSITYLFDKIAQEYVYSINAHLGIGLEHRLESSKLISHFADDLLQINPSSKIIVTGDFNTFPQSGGAEQLRIFEECGILKQPSEGKKLLDGTPADSTFISFPYDFAKDDQRLNMAKTLSAMSPEECYNKTLELFTKECSATGGVLDHMLYSGFKDCQMFVIPKPLFEDGPHNLDEKAVKDYILRHSYETTDLANAHGHHVEVIGEFGPAYASDHQPCLGIFEY